MNRSLIQAAQTGDVDHLVGLLRDDPLLLRAVALADGDNPLHVACMAGNLNFVKKIIRLRKEFVFELNQEGYSPLHIASANGDVEIVKELLKTDLSLCHQKGRDRRIPLHIAVVKGKLLAMKELLLAGVDTIKDATARGESTLYLALKNNQFDAFVVLIEHLKKFNLEDVLNMKDFHGNTILHLAVSQKQFEFLDFLLNERVVPIEKLGVNSLNKKGFTPLDVLLIEGGDQEIEEILGLAGSKRSHDLQSSTTQITVNGHQLFSTNNTSSNDHRSRRHRTPSKQLQDYFKFDKSKESPTEVRNTLLVIAILIATATYQAVLSPPGGLWQDSSSSDPNVNNNNSTKTHVVGKAVMGYSSVITYGLFLVFNSAGFFMSLYMISFLTVGFPMQFELQVSIVALIVTYDICMVAITSDGGILLIFTVLSSVMPLSIAIVTKVVRNYLLRSRFLPACLNHEPVCENSDP